MSRGPLEFTIWLVAAVAWIALFFITSGDLLEITVFSVPFLLVIALVSLPWRTVSWKHLVGFFMLGVGPVFLLAAWSQQLLDGSPIEDWVRSGLNSLADGGNDLRLNNLGQNLWAPITEELLKVTPLLAFIWWRRTGLRTLAGPLDYAVIAGATGAGMAFSEDILVFLNGFFTSPPSNAFALRLGPVYEGLVGATHSGLTIAGRSGFADNMSFFFPEMQELRGAVWSGHGALALGLGLSIGLALYARRRYKTRAFYLIPFVVYIWAVWEHVMANWFGGAACGRRESPLCTVATIDLHGRVYPLLVLAAFGLAIYLSRELIRAHREIDPALNLSRDQIDRSAYQAGIGGTIAIFRDRLDLARWRRKTAFGRFHLEHSKRLRVYQGHALMAARIKTLMIRERLEGSPPTPLSEEVRAALTHVTPMS